MTQEQIVSKLYCKDCWPSRLSSEGGDEWELWKWTQNEGREKQEQKAMSREVELLARALGSRNPPEPSYAINRQILGLAKYGLDIDDIRDLQYDQPEQAVLVGRTD